MIFLIFRRAASMALFVALPCACNSSSPTATVFVSSYIQPAGPGTVCDYGTMTPWFDIGAPTGKDPTVVANGGTQGGGQGVTVGCTVHPDGAGFDVALNASLGDHGSITITSLSGKAISPSEGGPVSATFQSQKMGTWTSEMCKLSYEYQTGPVPRMPPVAAGRIWAHVSCLLAERNDGEMRGLPDGGIGLATCDTEADFLFEFCNE
jgi:hypothetical protein